jgi:predicted CXXCH cytochrome family protein
MRRHNPEVVIQRLPILIALLLCLAATRMVVTADLAEAKEADDVICDYTLYLREPQPRAKFIAMREQLHEITTRMASPDLRYQFEFKVPENQPKRYIDEASTRCLGCHDEEGAVKKFGSSGSTVFIHAGMSKMSQAHPVGLMYERRTLDNANLKSSADFPPNMVLVYGRLSCITCHDPLNPEGNHLAEKNRGTLCFACHNM